MSTFNDVLFWNTVDAHFRERLSKMTSSTSTATPMRHVFQTRVADVKSPKSEINAIILDYLTIAGYPKAAAKFSKEANLQPQQEDSSIQARQEIQHAIHTGSIEYAIEALNDLDPEILDKDSKLHFSLLRLQLVELIRQSGSGDISAALEFATRNLAPRASTNKSFLTDLEKTMTLLIFPHDNLSPELAVLLKSDLRRAVADDVNKAILFRQTQRREAAIQNLVKMRSWAENEARIKKMDLPQRIDLGLNGEDNDVHDDGSPDNGHELMITT